jgi:hypothetical protein
MTATTLVLPDRDDMLRRLNSVLDDPHAEAGLYPRLLKHAGQQKQPEGVVVMFMLAIADYTEGLPPAVAVTLDIALPRFIGALIDDEGLRQEALTFLQSVQ